MASFYLIAIVATLLCLAVADNDSERSRAKLLAKTHANQIKSKVLMKLPEDFELPTADDLTFDKLKEYLPQGDGCFTCGILTSTIERGASLLLQVDLLDYYGTELCGELSFLGMNVPCKAVIAYVIKSTADNTEHLLQYPCEFCSKIGMCPPSHSTCWCKPFDLTCCGPKHTCDCAPLSTCVKA